MKVFLLMALMTIQFSYAGVRLASYNIRNFDYDYRSDIHTNKQHLVNQIVEMKPDIMAVQEINETEKFETMIDRHFNGKMGTVLSECGGSAGQKLGFVYNTEKFKLVNFTEDLRTADVNNSHHLQASCHSGSRPLAIGTFKKIDNGETFLAISVHLKAGSHAKSIKKRFKQMEIIKKVVAEYKELGINNYVIMGDFNSTEYIKKKSKSHKNFKKSVNQMSAVNLANNLSCTSYWWGGRDDMTQYPSILDHIIVSENLANGKSPKIKAHGHCAKLKCQATPEFNMGISFEEVSDHCPVVAEIK